MYVDSQVPVKLRVTNDKSALELNMPILEGKEGAAGCQLMAKDTCPVCCSELCSFELALTLYSISVQIFF